MEAGRQPEKVKKPMTAKERRRIEEMQKPEPAVVQEFSGIRKRLDAKLVRLHPDYGCEQEHTVSFREECAGRIVGASRYPLRGDDITPDIHYDRQKIVGEGFFNIVMMADLGQAVFEDVDLDSERIKKIFDFEVPTTWNGARNLHEALSAKGSAVDGLMVKDRIPASPGMTFAIRIIAYKAKDMDGFLIPRNAAPEFAELRWDGRRDVMLVAKIVQRADDGSVHLLWRELGRKDAPAIRFEEGAPPIDFRYKGN